MRDAIRKVFWGIHQEREGQAVLAAGQMVHMVRVEDRDYNVIREMERQAEHVVW